MSIAGYNTKILTVTIPDPTADVTIPLMIAPAGGIRILAAYAALSTAVTADATNKVTCSIIDGGAAGAGTTEIGVRTGGASVGWTANGLSALTVSSAELDGGAHLLAKYDESGTVAPGYVTFCIHWVQGGSE